MKKINKFLIILVTMLVLTHPQALPTNASKIPALQPPNPHQTFQSIPLQSVDIEDDDWIIECVECPPMIGGMSNRSLQLDADGFPHIAYGGDNLYYAFFDGETWQHEIIDQPSTSVSQVSLVLDANDLPHIGYFDGLSREIIYAYKNNTGWHLQVVASDGSNISPLVLDGDGNPHISYRSEALKYAHRDNAGSWHVQVVDSTNNDWRPSLAVDISGAPHISYYDNPYWDGPPFPNQLKYAHLNGPEWQIETIYDGTIDDHWIYGNDIAIDVNDRPHISFIESYRLDIKTTVASLGYARRVDNGWHVEKSISSANSSTSLALDHNGFPHITYIKAYTFYENHSNLVNTFLDPDGWHTITVVTNEEDWRVDSPSLTIDDHNHAHISYFNSRDGSERKSLLYTEFNGTSWDFQTVDTKGGDVGTYNSLVLDSSNNAHISYYDAEYGDLKYALRTDDGWNLQTVDDQENVGMFSSVAIDQNKYPHTSYKGPNKNLKYAFRDENGWQTQVVGSKEIGWYTILDLDEHGYPHISYRGGGFENPLVLKYAHQDQSGWHSEVVDDFSTGGSLSSNSFKLDTDGNPHFTYSGRYSEYYKYWNGSSWKLEIVDSGSLFGATSMDLDAVGYPHISYFEDYYQVSPHIFTLNYAYKDASGWQVSHVTGNLGYYGQIVSTSLALDEGGQPHISYISGCNLLYTHLEDSGWQFTTINNNVCTDTSTSLALDTHEYPHISYNLGYNLMYAYLPAYRVIAEPIDGYLYGKPGDLVIGTLSVKNRGQETDSFDVSITSNAWLTTSSESIGPLEASENSTLNIYVTIPPTATLVSSDTATITLTSQSDPTVSASATLTTYAAITTYLPLVSR